MTDVETVSFTYDPLTLVRLVMDIHSEKLEATGTKASRFARYKYLETMNNKELESLLQRYVTEEKLDAITLEDSEKDCEFIFGYIHESKRFKKLEFDYLRKGNGATKYGVADLSDETYYDCSLAKHWTTIMRIIKEKYPHYDKALEKMYYHNDLNEYNDITRKELDDFIMNRFELIGATNRLDSYI